MGYYYTAIAVSCDVDGCKNKSLFNNDGHQAPYWLDKKPLLAGWYIPVGGGNTLCPMHADALAKKAGLPSLWAVYVPAGVPIKRDEADKTQKAKEGAD